MQQFEPFQRVLLTIEYDGSGFYGWQRQENFRSVQLEVEKALSKCLHRETTIWGASRTDTGVSAVGQRAHFHNFSTIPAERFAFVLNTMLPPDVRIRASREVPETLHARFSCRGKIYTYRIFNNRHASAIRRNWTTHIPVHINEERMRDAAQRLVGTYDFGAFQAAGGTAKSTIRTIHGIDITRDGDDITMVVRGNAFLYNMVRIIAGTLMEIGTGKRAPGAIAEAIESGNRLALGQTAPAKGLMLMRVLYEGDEEKGLAYFGE